ncbi:uncharacterized protein [Panulirus ornatus]|uniref:uncharacterized protein n=1 Tax=Panulirus ornatus TaxID=150431 RepID=UPI003A86475E
MDPAQFQGSLTATTSRVSIEPTILSSSSSNSTSTSSSTSTSFTSVTSISYSSISSSSLSSISSSSDSELRCGVSSTSCNNVSHTSNLEHTPTSCCWSNPASSRTVTPSASNSVLSLRTSSPLSCVMYSPATCDLHSAAAGDPDSHTVQFATPAASSLTSKSDSSSRGPICRICHEGESLAELISPCWCTGSVGAVHKACLERWLTLASCDKCELCGYSFPVTRLPKPFWKFLLRCDNPGIRRALLVDGVCLLLLTPLAVASIYLCIMGAVYYANEDLHSEDAFINHLLVLATEGHQTIQEGEDDSGSTEQPRRRRPPGLSEDWEERAVPWETMALVLLALVLIAVYLAWAIMAFSYQARVWKRWRVVHQDLLLVDTGLRPSRLGLPTSFCHNLRSNFSPVSLQSIGVFPDQHSNSADTLLARTAGEELVSPGKLNCDTSLEELGLQLVGQKSASREEPSELNGSSGCT